MRKNLRPEELGDFLEQPKLAILATTYKDGRVKVKVVTDNRCPFSSKGPTDRPADS